MQNVTYFSTIMDIIGLTKQTAQVMTDFICANVCVKMIKRWTGRNESIAWLDHWIICG